MTEKTALNSATDRIITWRSLVFGLLGIFIMSGLAGYHDSVLGGTIMIGNHMPGGAFSYFMFMGLGWNGFWVLMDRLFKANGRIRDAMALTMKEMITVMAVTLVACFPPTSGLGRYFHRMIMLPWYYLHNRPDWVTHELLTKFMRPELFPAPWPGTPENVNSVAYDTVYRGFFTGLANGSNTIPLWKLPLAAWLKPMMVWAPLIFLMSLSIISLQFLVHRQWSKHEQLSYPVAQVAGSFCYMSGGKAGIPDIFKNRLFWWGFLPVISLLLIQYLSLWYPESVPTLAQMMPSLKSWNLLVVNKIPILKKVPEIWSLNGQTLYFTILGLAYFVSSEISLTMGMSTIAFAIFGSLFFLSTGTSLETSWISSGRAGAYIGYTGILIYTGRHYFKEIFAKALGLNRKKRSEDVDEDDEAVSVIAARILMLALAAFTMVLAWLCQSWLMAIFYSLLLMIMYLVLSRIVCESGIPFVQSGWAPGEILLRLLGPAALGPKALTFMLWSTGTLAQDPRESLMPYVATGVKAAEEGGMKLKRLFWVLIGAVALALVVAYFSSTYSLYNFNPMGDSWASQNPPVSHFDSAARNFNILKSAGLFEESLNASVIQRLGMLRSSPMESRFFISGLLAIVACAMMRFRFTKFPIHPLLFLVVAIYPTSQTWGSFLLGWFVKMLVVRFGGGGVYQKLKPLFIGLISAELAMVGFSVLIDFLYVSINGTPSPVSFSVMPG